MASRDDYALVSKAAPSVPAPALEIFPATPTRRHRIALVGAGGISFAHLDAYRTHGFEVAAILSRDREKAAARAAEFFPDAEVMTDYAALLRRDDITVLDLTPHPADRLPLMEAALRAGKHVLSQKPFVSSLDDGERLVALADAAGVKLAVNQNGRWAPHMAYLREASRTGLIGDVTGVHCSLHWNHTWVRGTPFAQMNDLVLFDFGVHWFDFVTSIFARTPRRVLAQALPLPATRIGVPLLASALLDFGTAQASLVFDAATPFGASDTTYIAGTRGSLAAVGPDLGQQSVTLTTEAGVAVPELTGSWFNDGFAGAMGALLIAIEAGTEPPHSARSNLMSLATAFAAIEAARTGLPQIPGTVRTRPSVA